MGRSVPRALRDGIEKADELQPDSRSRDNYFWSHCARYYSRASLAMEKDPSWTLIGDVANTGIHIILNSVHRIRVLRSLNDQPPPAGGSRARREAWAQPSAQSAFFHTATNELLVDPPPDTLPAMNLLLDWREESAEPIVYVSLPIGPWGFNERVRVHWREPLMDLEDDLGDLAFDPPRAPTPRTLVYSFLWIRPNKMQGDWRKGTSPAELLRLVANRVGVNGGRFSTRHLPD